MVSRPAGRAPLFVLAFGAVLLVAAAWHHASEIGRIDRVNGPMLALALDGSLALAVASGGYLLGETDLAPEHRGWAAVWCLLGAWVFVGTVAISIGIQRFEGRTVAEPTFQLLLAADAGALAGLVAGYFYARARESAREAERATAALEFVNDLLRHDVRNCVSAIFVHTDLIRRESDDEAVADSATTIREQADEVTGLVENTGAIVEAMSADSEYGRVDLAAVAEDTARQVDGTFDATVTTDVPERAPVAANEAVRSVVSNLVENAAEHNDAADPRVEVSAVNRDGTVRLRVADNGSGVADPRKTRVFEPSGEDRHGGGLHLVATLADNYGGSVWVEDNDAGGATFVLELPRHDAES